MAAGAPTPTEYVKHHITNLSYGEGLWTFHLDTLAVSFVLGLFFLTFFVLAARRATSGVPGKLQNFVEMLVDFVDESVKGSFH